MNENPEIQTLLHKFILNQCTTEEINEVVDYCKKNKLTAGFPTVEEVQALLTETPKMDKTTADQIFSKILVQAQEMEEQETRKFPFKRYMAIAASIVVLLSIGFSYRNNLNAPKNKPVINSNDITLQLENGEIQVISEGKKSKVTDAHGQVVGNQNGNKIAYDTETSLEKLVYNTLKIPNGKRFELELSDGTIVHLNSGTTLKYPVKFIAGENRQVFLEGEAFFDVAKDKTHPFIVNADKLNIRVLGTHFNVSSFPEDDLTDVVLVEGSVGMYSVNENFDANKNTILKPGLKGSFNKDNNRISTKEVNTELYTAWINGGLIFRNISFSNICKKLERRYDVTIIIKNSKLANEKFNASFIDKPLDKVLTYFKDVYGFDYTTKDKVITIK
ncbi:FecR family protein [Flavobacterium sp. HJJ]|uniref:FecR family protein n=1 Tax=Flavobacterium sp. HJJ TaxID=2783792 RepID=UPI00188BA6DB|nr:FecR family protein [Flavobacterium sp. HJJ]MBF4471704.1 FecR family protein [Flavobacterium sp. HJJ]